MFHSDVGFPLSIWANNVGTIFCTVRFDFVWDIFRFSIEGCPSSASRLLLISQDYTLPSSSPSRTKAPLGGGRNTGLIGHHLLLCLGRDTANGNGCSCNPQQHYSICHHTDFNVIPTLMTVVKQSHYVQPASTVTTMNLQYITSPPSLNLPLNLSTPTL